jgi:GrpB-like predicted nucleotidyltransferase (UPF0157 family)
MIEIHHYKSEWPAEFEIIRANLSEILGELALRIDHIGSTSVPGLGAKDIIDVQVTVESLEPEIERCMIAAGYQYRADITHDHLPCGENADPQLWEKNYFEQPPGRRPAHIHVRVKGRPNQIYPLLFRDYLRAHPDSAATIERIKHALAQYHADDKEAYYAIKDPIYDLIWDAAKEWARGINWQPD